MKYYEIKEEDKPVKAHQFDPDWEGKPWEKRLFCDIALKWWFKSSKNRAQRIRYGDWVVKQYGHWYVYTDEDFKKMYEVREDITWSTITNG